MRVEELFKQESPIQSAVILQRVQYETEVGTFPNCNPLTEPPSERGDEYMSELMSPQTEERLVYAIKHLPQVVNDEQLGVAIPLKRNDSGSHQHRLQACSLQTGSILQQSERGSRHEALLNEIDNNHGSSIETKEKTPKKESTLTRLLKGVRGEKDVGSVSVDRGSQNMSIGRMIQKINPVGKNSRDNISRVLFHRIGDVIQKKSDDPRGGSTTALKIKSDRNPKTRVIRLSVSKSGAENTLDQGREKRPLSRPSEESEA